MDSKESIIFRIRINNKHLNQLKSIKVELDLIIVDLDKYLKASEQTIPGLEIAIMQGVYPHKYGKRTKYYYYNAGKIEESNLEISDINISDLGRIEKYDKFGFIYEDEIRQNLKKNKYWFDKWENLSRIFNEELRKITEEIKNITELNNEYKKQVMYYETLVTLSQEDKSDKKKPSEIIQNNQIDEELRKPKYGELTNLVRKYAKELNLILNETVSDGNVEKIRDKIKVEKKIETTKNSIKSILGKLDYRKRRGY